MTDRRPTRPIEVMAFNGEVFVAGAIAVAVAALGAVLARGRRLPRLLAAAAIGGAIQLALASGAIAWVFGAGATSRWAWIAEAAGRPDHWANVTTGFDDSTDELRRRLPGTDGVAIDLFDPDVAHERAITRVRRRAAPPSPPIRATSLADVLPKKLDAVFLLMAAHEVDPGDRPLVFDAIANAIGPRGRLVLVEHLRDGANALAFGPGARHFQTRATWVRLGQAAGLRLEDDVPLTLFVRGFVFVRDEAHA